MRYRVRLLVPTDNEAELGPVIGRLTGVWGAILLLNTKGYYQTSTGKVLRERLSILEVSVPNWDNGTREWFSDLIEVVRKQWARDAVQLSVHEESDHFIGRGQCVGVIGGEL